MGTNYYAIRDVCPTCKHVATRLHVGKSSVGWKFCFHAIDYLELKSYRQWMDYISECGAIFDEYDRELTLDEFKELVESKQCDLDNTKAYVDTRYYNDQEGYNFLDCEFS